MTAGPEPAGALAELLARVAAGQYPPPDGGITILPQPSPRDCGVISFTAHSVIFTDADPGWVRAQLPVARRWEVAVEVEPDRRGRGLGRELAAAARHLIPAGAPLWAQIAPGNAASVPAFLAAGYRPVGAEALIGRQPP